MKDRRALGARVVDLEHANPRAIVDGGELIEPPSRTGDALQEFHIELQSVPGLRFLIALPTLPVRLMFLIGGQAMHPVSLEDSMCRGARDRKAMEPVQVRRDSRGSKVIALAQIQDLVDNVPRCGSRRALRRSWSIAEAGIAVLGVSLFPLVERLPGHPESPADPGDVLLLGRLP
jgi:hypothetical protein